MNYLTIGAYKFIKLEALPELNIKLKTAAEENALSGTILLSPEGINLMLSGLIKNIQKFKYGLANEINYPDFSDLHYKEHYADSVSFKRLFIKIKKEIIAFGIQSADPVSRKAVYVKPDELKKWLDNQQEIYILDTRNHYEINAGSFKNALNLNLQHFRDFPQEAKKLDENLKNKTLVTVCTGGIRCEKAALLLENYGFKQVYQLEGGILDYFKYAGSEHFQGKCFVFDQRGSIEA